VHALLTAAGFDVLIPQRLPVNDAAISFGQLIEAIAVQRSAP
jgi:hydrogenase maturation factor HypF (carbamoyltransferase family)